MFFYVNANILEGLYNKYSYKLIYGKLILVYKI